MEYSNQEINHIIEELEDLLESTKFCYYKNQKKAKKSRKVIKKAIKNLKEGEYDKVFKF